MDSRRLCPSYEDGFSTDPFGLLEWSRSDEPARVLRRRCRSEDVERNTYEDVNRALPLDYSRHRVLANKSYFTLTTCSPHLDRYHLDCTPPAAVNGDYLMAYEANYKSQGYESKMAKSKFLRSSPTRSLKLDNDRLPKVEELFEKVDQEIMEFAVIKQPLKSILNNPLPKSPPPSILKKPKKSPEAKCNGEGRRRQRAYSDSDNFYTNYRLGSPPAYDCRKSCNTNDPKRIKVNSATGYSYGSALASLHNTPVPKSPKSINRNGRCDCIDRIRIADDLPNMHILRTTAINRDTVNVSPTRAQTPNSVQPSLPVNNKSPISPPKSLPVNNVKVVKKKIKPKSDIPKMKLNTDPVCNGADVNTEESDLSRSPSPDLEKWSIIRSDGPKLEPSIIVPVNSMCKQNGDATLEHNSIAKLSTKLNGTAVTPKKMPSKESSIDLPESMNSFLRQSLFPRVPPYLRFASHEDGTQLKVPPAIQKHLKWKVTTITPIVVKKTLVNSGFRLVRSECDTAECPQEETVEWIGIWGKHMKSVMFRAIKDGQKMNHFPGTFQIGRKDRLWRNLQKLVAKYGVKEFGIMPRTYVLPYDLKLLKHNWEKYAENNERWIIKPPASARGTGIKVVSKWTQIPKKRPVVVQRYVAKPYLINGSKFDMRLYVLVTSIHPLRIYLYKDGLARFASVKYSDELGSLNDRYMHLTNYSINRLSKNYTPNEDFAACEGHKWTLETLFQFLKTEKGVDIDQLWESMKDLVIKTIISGEASISALTKANVTSRYNCYELFGIDVLLDEDLKPWLLEVNISPSLHSASPLDIHVKGPLVTAALNLAQFHLPRALAADRHGAALNGLLYDSRLYTIYLSKEERDKHIIYTNMEDRDMYLRDILSTLTPDDVRHLVQAEDEAAAVACSSGTALERVFPSRGSHRYLPQLAGPRYYNRLLDAWEHRYSRDRRAGIELLRNLCDIGYHLEVPPVPLKNDVDAPSPAPSAPCLQTDAASEADAEACEQRN